MTSELLKKEKEYHKLNEQLQTRTKELLQEADAVIASAALQYFSPLTIFFLQKTHDTLSRDSVIVNTYNNSGYGTQYPNKYDAQLMRKNSSSRSLSRDTCADNAPAKDDFGIVPGSVNEMGTRGMTHFFRATLKQMQVDYDQLQGEHRTKCDELKKLQKHNQKLTEDKEKWFQISTGHKTHITKLENKVTALNSKLQSKENENASLKKDVDQLQKELKNETVNVTNLELKLKNATDESEKCKMALKNAKQDEKDLRETHRKQICEMSGIIKRIEKHKLEILNGFKKQMLLIDNLKKQKAHIEQYKLIEKAENEFMKVLEWKIEN